MVIITLHNTITNDQPVIKMVKPPWTTLLVIVPVGASLTAQ